MGLPPPPNGGLGGGPNGNSFAELAVVLIVITTAAELLPGVTELGEKVHSEVVGAPEQDRLTDPGNNAPTGKTLKL